MKLYESLGSSSAWRVRWALAIKGLRYESIRVDLLAGEQLKPEYGQINPMNAVPALVTDSGEVLTESVAIIEWLEETQPQPALLPADPLQRARVREMVQVINAGTQPLQSLRVQKAHSHDSEEQQAWARSWIDRGLRAYEVLAARAPGRFSLGDSVTLADLYLIPQCRNAEKLGLRLSSLPRISLVYTNCLLLPELRATDPARLMGGET